MKLLAGALLFAVLVAGCAPKVTTPPPVPGSPGASPGAVSPSVPAGTNLGQSLYTSGVGISGTIVPFAGGSDKFQASPTGCIRCHGGDGLGVKGPKGMTPAITYASLRAAQGDKPALYASDEALQKAVTEGLEPNGEHLSNAMPCWKLNDAEWAALLEYLKSLDKPATPAKPAAEKPAGT